MSPEILDKKCIERNIFLSGCRCKTMMLQLIHLQNYYNIYTTYTHKINDTITKKEIAKNRTQNMSMTKFDQKFFQK